MPPRPKLRWWAGPGSHQAFVSTDGGRTWRSCPTAQFGSSTINFALGAPTFPDPTSVVVPVLTDPGGGPTRLALAAFDDLTTRPRLAGVAETSSLGPTSVDSSLVGAAPSGALWATNGTAVWRTTVGASGWTPTESSGLAPYVLSAIYPISSMSVVAVGSEGFCVGKGDCTGTTALLSTTDGGQTWSADRP